MDETKYTPTFAVLLGIVEVLRDSIINIDKIYEQAGKELKAVWEKL